MDLLVLAKEPVAGRVKTRLTPPCSPAQAAAIAEAAVADTLAAAMATRADRVVLVLDGEAGRWCPAGVTVVPQGVGSLADRLDTAWRATEGPALQIGMDTPQVTAAELDAAMDLLEGPDVDAVLGDAVDGGWWAIGLRQAHPRAFVGIATSRADTGRAQRARLHDLGLRTHSLSAHRDVDTWDDALLVAAAAPGGRFAATVQEVVRTIW